MATTLTNSPTTRPPTSGPASLSVLDVGLVFDGKLSGDGHVTVMGQFKGVMEVAQVLVRELGRVEGRISGEVVDIRGDVAGDVAARSVNLFKGCNVEGDIRYEKLHLEPGSSLNGRCDPIPAETAP